MQLSEKAQESAQKFQKQDSSWLPHIEVITYSGPHRRLWMGPQFSFGVYAPTGHSSAQLVFFYKFLLFFSSIQIMTQILMSHKKFVQF